MKGHVDTRWPLGRTIVAFVVIALLMLGILEGCITPSATGSAQPSNDEEEKDVITQAYTEGRYLDAIRLYEKALSDPSSVITETMKREYYDSIDKYVEVALDKARTVYGTEKDYDSALYVLETFYDEAEGIDVIQDTLEEAGMDYLNAKYMDLVDEAYQAENYLLVAKLYEEASWWDVEITESMEQQYEDSVTKYVASVSSMAQAAFGDKKDYNAAMSAIRPALVESKGISAIMGQLETMMNEYAEYAPVPLSSLSCTQSNQMYYNSKYGSWRESNAQDVNGEFYNIENVLFPIHEYYDSDAEVSYIQYMLNYQYSTFAGVVFRPYTSLSCADKWNYPGTVKIYGDGQLLYQAPGITKNTYNSYPFSLDVSGVREVKIIMHGTWRDGYSSSPKVCLGDLELQK